MKNCSNQKHSHARVSKTEADKLAKVTAVDKVRSDYEAKLVAEVQSQQEAELRKLEEKKERIERFQKEVVDAKELLKVEEVVPKAKRSGGGKRKAADGDDDDDDDNIVAEGEKQEKVRMFFGLPRPQPVPLLILSVTRRFS